MTPVASLPMYDWPERRAAQGAFWAAVRGGLRARGVDAPEALSDVAAWDAPGLVFSQTCGWPWATAWRDALDLVAVPVGSVPGCAGDTYSSMVVVRAGSDAAALADLRGRTVAYNGADSQSGVHTLREAVAGMAGGRPFFGRGIETGAHRDSIWAVAAGRADCAAIDAVCWAMAREHDRAAVAALRIVHRTAPAPALPFVTRKGGPVRAVRAALEDAMAAGFGAPLHIDGLADPDPARYDSLVTRVADMPLLFPT